MPSTRRRRLALPTDPQARQRAKSLQSRFGCGLRHQRVNFPCMLSRNRWRWTVPKRGVLPHSPVVLDPVSRGHFFAVCASPEKHQRNNSFPPSKRDLAGSAPPNEPPSNLGRVGAQLLAAPMDQITGRKGSVDSGCPVLYLSLATMSQVFPSHPELLPVRGSHRRRMLYF